MSTVSTKPYLLRALYEWCADQGFTPYLSVRVDANTVVPRQFVQDGMIVLNLGQDAVQNLHMGNDLITCQARFSGIAQALSVPIDNVVAIYARENGQGMAFELEQIDVETDSKTEASSTSTQSEEQIPLLDSNAPNALPTDTPPSSPSNPPQKSHLTRVK